MYCSFKTCVKQILLIDSFTSKFVIIQNFLVGISRLNPTNKKSQLRNFFHKSQKILNPPIFLDIPKKLDQIFWSSYLGRLAKKSRNFSWITILKIGQEKTKKLVKINSRILFYFLLVRLSPGLGIKS